jgi:sirohydrochlorin cobaltochelatase
MMKSIIVLAMHGVPPRDFPEKELAEFFRLHSQRAASTNNNQENPQDRYSFLNNKIRNWTRNEQNDPFHIASQELAKQLTEISGIEVIVGYNEFCAPSLEEALQSAVNKNADKIIIATPMMTRGGEHTEKEIPAKIKEFSKRCPKVEIKYAWPFDTLQVARFLSEHISRFA